MEYPGAHTLSNRLDRPTLAGAVASLEHHADLQTLVDNPSLQLDQLNMQFFFDGNEYTYKVAVGFAEAVNILKDWGAVIAKVSV